MVPVEMTNSIDDFNKAMDELIKNQRPDWMDELDKAEEEYNKPHIIQQDIPREPAKSNKIKNKNPFI